MTEPRYVFKGKSERIYVFYASIHSGGPLSALPAFSRTQVKQNKNNAKIYIYCLGLINKIEPEKKQQQSTNLGSCWHKALRIALHTAATLRSHECSFEHSVQCSSTDLLTDILTDSIVSSSLIAEYGSTGQGCQSCSWSPEQGK